MSIRTKLIKDLMSVAEAYKNGDTSAIGTMTDMGLLLDNFMQAESQKSAIPILRLSSEKIDELWDSFCEDVPDDPERVMAMRGTRRMNKSRFLDALGSITDEA